ncbi:MAG: hypothetical protein ACI8ZM_000483 [Crocinitomix sp.]|jgi:hypothetical protein
MKKYKYDVALSFADEDVDVAVGIYLALKSTKEQNTVYYYKKNLDTAGTPLKKVLPDIYKNQARFVIMLVSASYIDKNKRYVPLEAEAILARWKSNPQESFLIPVLVDGTKLDKVDSVLTGDIAYEKWTHDPEILAEKIWDRVRKLRKEDPEDKKKEANGDTVIFNNGDLKSNTGPIIQTGINHGDINYNS